MKMNSCRRIMFFCLCLIMCSTIKAQLQSGKMTVEVPDGIVFNKTIEPAMIAHGLHNTKGKTGFQLKFFPKYNGRIEFLVDPSFSGVYGFRIDSVNEQNCTLTVRWVSDWDEVQKKMEEEFPVKDSRASVLKDKSKKEEEEILIYNRQQYSKRFSKAASDYTLDTKTVHISKFFVDKLYETITLLIDKHINKGIPSISKDGYIAIFRCVVGAEVWNFSTRNPHGIFKELTNICNQIVSDVKEDGEEIDEEKYIVLLKNLVEVN